MTQVSAFPFQCLSPLRRLAQAGTPARLLGRGRRAGACPWFEVDGGETRKGRGRPGWPRLGAAYPDPPGIGRDSWGGQRPAETSFKVAGGHASCFKRAGIAWVPAVPETQPERSGARRVCERPE